jgi:glucose-1-phosphate adenylyltransferase
MAAEPKILSLILGGGRGTRLFPLTQQRAKPAVPVAGKYRLIDIPISNCINSGLNQVYVLTQYLSVSLHQHIANTYKFDMFGRGFVEILAAMQTLGQSNWYQGTADAVRQNLEYLKRQKPDMVLILSGDQLYRMDFRQLIATHQAAGADVTIAGIPVKEDQTINFGLMKVNDAGRVTGFVEKPKSKAERDPYYTPKEWIEAPGREIPCNGRHFIANMGIYLFDAKFLTEILETSEYTDFGKEVFPNTYQSREVHAHLSDGYWEDLGTIKSYHECSIALADLDPPFDFFQGDDLIYTRMRNLPASRVEGAKVDRCLIAEGCRIGPGCELSRSMFGVRSRIGKNSIVRETVTIGSDAFTSHPNIGDNCVIERAILDKDCRVGNNVRLVNKANVDFFGNDDDDLPYYIRDGIICVPRGGVVPDGTVV